MMRPYLRSEPPRFQLSALPSSFWHVCGSPRHYHAVLHHGHRPRHCRRFAALPFELLWRSLRKPFSIPFSGTGSLAPGRGHSSRSLPAPTALTHRRWPHLLATCRWHSTSLFSHFYLTLQQRGKPNGPDGSDPLERQPTRSREAVMVVEFKSQTRERIRIRGGLLLPMAMLEREEEGTEKQTKAQAGRMFVYI